MKYTPRLIEFKQLLKIDNWDVKLYTICKHKPFTAKESVQAAVEQLPKWLKQKNGFNDDHDHLAFLILHQGTEGVFSLMNWWVGGNMLNTNIYFSEHEQPGEFKLISGSGLAPCIWELEVIDFERRALTKHLFQENPPSRQTYLQSNFTKEI